MYVCICAAVTDQQITHELNEGAGFTELQDTLCVAKQCCSCAEFIHKMVASHDKYPDETD